MNIPLTNGMNAQVDEEDFESISKYRWYALKCPPSKTWYAVATIDHKRIRMHRLILGLSGSIKTDHIDRNGLNNTRSNIRPATQSQNMANCSGHKNNTSGFKGVYWDKRKAKWRVQIWCENVRYTVGRFKDKIEAAKAYDTKAVELFGQYAGLNFPNL